MKIENVEIDKLTPYANNPKAHPQEQVDRIARSIEAFGFKTPILVDQDNVIIAGHGRLLAARQLKLVNVPVIRAADLTPDQVRAYRIADNKVAESAWIDDVLKQELISLRDSDLDPRLFLLDDFDALNANDEKSTEKIIKELFEIVIFDLTEELQVKLLERLLREGYRCKAFIS